MINVAGDQVKLRTSEKRDLETEVGFFEALSIKDPNWPELLDHLARDYRRLKQFTRLYNTMKRLVEIQPDAKTYYNCACACALYSESVNNPSIYIAEGINMLKLAIKHGWNDYQMIKKDPDLEMLRNEPVFNNQIMSSTK